MQADDELAPRRLVTYTDSETGDETTMEVYLELEVEGRTYALLIPLHLPVEIVRAVGKDLDEIEPMDPSEIKGLKKLLDEALARWGVHAEIEGEEIMLVGDPPDEFYDDCDTVLEIDTDDDETEEYAVVVELDTGGERYLVITPVVPDLMPAELLKGERARELSDEEMEDLEETFRAALKAQEEEEDEED
ncbi:MAG: DUF3727 domain-containing protein [Myxococcales bacterium]|nr:DUF3727 domain-containing protein [Myxococcales bacterium]